MGFMLGKTNGNNVFPGGADAGEVIGQIGKCGGCFYRHHSATNIHADSSRWDGTVHGDDASNSHASACVNIGHDGDAVNPRKERCVADLLLSGVVNVVKR